MSKHGRRVRVRSGERGFTLVELLLVVAVVFVLLLVSSASFLGYVDRAYDARAKIHLAVSWKTAKGIAVEHDGRIPAVQSLAPALASSENRLTFATSPDGSDLQQTPDTLIVVDDDDTSESLYVAYVLSGSGKTWCIVAPVNGQHRFFASSDCKGAGQAFACSDGLDNDGDGLIDYPDDPGCDSLTDDDELGVAPRFESEATIPDWMGDRGAAVEVDYEIGGTGPFTITHYWSICDSSGLSGCVAQPQTGKTFTVPDDTPCDRTVHVRVRVENDFGQAESQATSRRLCADVVYVRRVGSSTYTLRWKRIDQVASTLTSSPTDGVQLYAPSAGISLKSPRISPDGRWIVFAQQGPSKIMKIRFDGTQLQELYGVSESDRLHQPQFNYDGTKIAFVDANGDDIWIMDADGSNRFLLWNGFDDGSASTTHISMQWRWADDRIYLAYWNGLYHSFTEFYSTDPDQQALCDGWGGTTTGCRFDNDVAADHYAPQSCDWVGWSFTRTCRQDRNFARIRPRAGSPLRVLYEDGVTRYAEWQRDFGPWNMFRFVSLPADEGLMDAINASEDAPGPLAPLSAQVPAYQASSERHLLAVRGLRRTTSASETIHLIPLSALLQGAPGQAFTLSPGYYLNLHALYGGPISGSDAPGNYSGSYGTSAPGVYDLWSPQSDPDADRPTGATDSYILSRDNGTGLYRHFLNRTQPVLTQIAELQANPLDSASPARTRTSLFLPAGSDVQATHADWGKLADTDTAPTSVSPPSISGQAYVGQDLSANPGSWNGTSLVASYQWLRCDSAGDGCQEIAYATQSSYRVAGADQGARLRVRVTVTSRSGAAASATSSATSVVLAAEPSNLVPPSIAGSGTYVGTLWSATAGTWSGLPTITFSYQWQRCSAEGTACSSIPGATESTYTLSEEDAGGTVRVRVTATNSAGSTSAHSSPTDVVAAQATPYEAEVLADNPYLYWQLEEPINRAVWDRSPNRYGAEIAGSPTRPVAVGHAGPANGYQFTASDQSVFRSAVTSAVTFEFWAKVDDLTSERILFENGSPLGSPYNGYNVTWHTDNRLRLRVAGGSSGSPFYLSDVGSLTIGAWHHIVIRRQGDTWRTFINGVQQVAAPSATFAAPTANLRLGRSNSGTTYALRGGIADFVVYESALSDARIGAHYAARAIAVPTIARFTPTGADVGAGTTSLTIYGSGFSPSSKVVFASTQLPTAFVSSEELQVQIPASLLSEAGSKSLQVRSSPTNLSNTRYFTVFSPGETYASRMLAGGPWLHWKLDETSGTTAADASANGRSGTRAGSPTPPELNVAVDPGHAGLGTAYRWSGTDYQRVERSTSSDNFGTDNLTISIWASRTTTSTSEASLFDNGSTSSSSSRLSLKWSAGFNSNWGLRLLINGSYPTYSGIPTAALNYSDPGVLTDANKHQLHHIVLQRDNGVWKVYIDGSLQSTSYATATPNVSASMLRVGSNAYLPNASAGVHSGLIADFAIFQRVLTQQEIEALYAARNR